MIKLLVFTIATLIIISCGKTGDVYTVTNKIGSSLSECKTCKLSADEKTLLNKICTSFETKLHTFRTSSPEFSFLVSGKDCTGGTVEAPTNKAVMNIQVPTSSFKVNDSKTNASKYISTFESHDYGLLKKLCAKKSLSSVPSQIEEGSYLYSYDFFETRAACHYGSYSGPCVMINKAKKTLAGQYIVKKSELISVTKDTTHSQMEGVVFRREQASLCFDEITSSHIIQELDSIN